MDALKKTISELVGRSPASKIDEAPLIAARAIELHPDADVILARHLASEVIINRALILQHGGKSRREAL